MAAFVAFVLIPGLAVLLVIRDLVRAHAKRHQGGSGP